MAPRNPRRPRQDNSAPIVGRSDLPVHGRGSRPGTNFEHIASISRSSGLDKDGDTLKDFAVQDEYRAFVQNKVTEYWRRYRRPQGMSEAEAKQRPEVEGNLLIHLRKLREGISSSKRCDGFSLEVYEVSLHLSIIFRSPVQTTSVIPPLLNLYSAAASASIPIQLPSSLASTTLLAQLHHLVVHFPSQRTLFDRTAPLYFTLADDSHLNTWIRSVARSLRRAEYAQLDILTRAPALDRLFAPSSDTPDLRKESLRTLAQDLRACARASAWRVLRNTYREVALAVGDTRSWATRALVLVDAEEKQEGYGEGDGSENEGAVDAWFMERDKLGEIVRKEGAQGRWVMVKVKS
ncbi:hypothetical protein FA95DRAFT_1683210 [Auriscalpium vulgare]|uniref:Uncharacterized protein n=1 Tax=Auriscalpium vulgare TaxID=40419 RepID=A0ACB8RC72_9AGAM|nr:hypothetical protein FA95DRAFT_1683210 [Auriscalpium vulgare]